MQNQYPECTSLRPVIVPGLEREIARILQGDNASSEQSAFLTDKTPWILWVEPIAESASEPGDKHCPPVFVGEGAHCDELSAKLEKEWEFSEFYWFIPGKTLHGIQTEQQAFVREITASNDSSVLRTPFIRRDFDRFHKLHGLSKTLNQSPLVSHQQLSFGVYQCSVSQQQEFILLTGESHGSA